MSSTMRDTGQPVVGRAEITIAAKPEAVWAVLADIDHWPAWNPEVSEACLLGELALGTPFRWQAGRWTINSKLERVDPPLLLGWVGKMPFISAVHIYRLEAVEEGTRVYTEESWAGWLPRLLRGPMHASLVGSLQRGLGYLKAEAERRVTMGQSESAAA